MQTFAHAKLSMRQHAYVRKKKKFYKREAYGQLLVHAERESNGGYLTMAEKIDEK